jgi:putative ABC transport system ATP-binding protein
MPNNTVFKLSNVNFSVDELNILKNISLNIDQNDFVVLLGPSGSGKSTLLRLLNGLTSPTTGEIVFHDESIQNLDTIELRKNVGMVFQMPTMINGSVKDNLTLPQNWIKETDSITESELTKILEQVGLNSDFLNKNAKSLSGGEQQRIALARVLLNKPEVLLLDEPTANLDPKLAQKIIELVFELYKEFNLTVVLISHHRQFIKQFAKQVVYLIDGQIVEIGNSVIIDNPKTTLAQDFITRKSE